MGDTESDRVTLKAAKRALNEIARGKREWLARRDKNPGLFEEELAEAFENIKAIPAFGAPTGLYSRGKMIRCVQMRKTKYEVYYRQDSETLVRIMSVWGGKRGKKPKLR